LLQLFEGAVLLQERMEGLVRWILGRQVGDPNLAVSGCRRRLCSYRRRSKKCDADSEQRRKHLHGPKLGSALPEADLPHHRAPLIFKVMFPGIRPPKRDVGLPPICDQFLT
jgi:hypothetical protein